MWRTTPGQAFRLRQFNDPASGEFVLYNDLTGATHLLGEAAMHLIQVLRCGPAASASLYAALATALGETRDPGFDAEAGEVLSQLAALFLIEEV